MPPTADANALLGGDFQRVADRAPTAELEPVVRRLVAEVPLRKQVLEIGCGTGALARELASKRGAKVTAVDLAPRMIDIARLRTSASLRVDYRVADIMALSPRGFDVAIAIDHSLPLADLADRMASAVVSGGQVLIAGGLAARSILDLPYNGLSRLLGHERSTVADQPSLRKIRATLCEVLPGATVRRHLGWRYTAVWTKP